MQAVILGLTLYIAGWIADVHFWTIQGDVLEYMNRVGCPNAGYSELCISRVEVVWTATPAT